MRKVLIGSSVAALMIVPALAAMPKGDHMMRETQKRADIEASVKEHFAMLDTNKDGVITKQEVDAFKTEHRAEMRDRMFAALDTDKNGQISKSEFEASHDQDRGDGDHGKGRHMGMRHGPRPMMGGDRMFEAADANNDGKVTLAEANARALAMFDKADANKDGTVTPEERRAVWKDRLQRKLDRPS